MERHHDDVPPPPYSETDLYSQHGRPPATSLLDENASSTASSSQSQIIYTPPETPRDTHHNSAGSCEDYQTTASAQAYFDTRPALRPNRTTSRRCCSPLAVNLVVAPDATPDDFPFPEWANQRETTEQDWRTFINYLMPDHSARANSNIIDRKLRDGAVVEDPSSPSGHEITEAQLGQLSHSSSNVARRDQSLRDIDATIHEWNNGFFEPRGVRIRRRPLSHPARPTPAPASGGQDAAALSNAEAQGQAGPQSREQGASNTPSRWNPLGGFMEATSRGVRIGPLHIEGDRVAFGDTFEAGSNGVRWRGNTLGNGPFGADASGRRGPTFSSNGPFGPFARGSGEGHRADAGGRNDPTRRSSRHDRGFDGHIRGRGRGGNGDRTTSGRRDHSISSSSSSSDSDSDLSIGSLPDWDDLKDTQLPVAKQSISEWLSHPDQPVTRDMVKSAKADIRAARRGQSSRSSTGDDLTRQALRQEVKVLLEQFRALKNKQRQMRRASRKEKRTQKRALRQERRQRRNAERGERRERRARSREFRRAEHEATRQARQRGGRETHLEPSHSFGPHSHHPLGPSNHGSRDGFLLGHPAVQYSPPLHVPGAFPDMPPHQSLSGPPQLFGLFGRAGGRGFSGGRGGRGRGGFFGRSGGWQEDLQQNHAARAAQGLPPYSDAHRAGGNSHLTSTNAGVAANYEAAWSLESQIAAKASELESLRAKIEVEGIEAVEKGGGNDDKRRLAELEAHQTRTYTLETEMEALGNSMERVLLRADEEFARQVAAEEEEEARKLRR